MINNTNARSYELTDVKAVMENMRSWASNWNDVLHYLEGASDRHPQLSREAVADLSRDIRLLQQENVRFTPNHREIWNELEDARKSKGDSATASSRVADIMHRLDSQEYRELSAQHARERNARWSE